MEPFPTSLAKHSHSSTFQSSTEKRLRNYQANLNGVENPIKLRPILKKKKKCHERFAWLSCLKTMIAWLNSRYPILVISQPKAIFSLL